MGSSGFGNLPGQNFITMDYGKKYLKHRSLCLECGNVIRYGRSDKKYCCDECKTRHHNNMAKESRHFRMKLRNALEKNYSILDELIRSGADSADLPELLAAGFVPGLVTSYAKSGRRHVFSCYDIKYIMTPTRISSIEKIQKLSLSL